MPTFCASFLPSLRHRLWYFDTSTLRAVGRKLHSSPIVDHAFTSSLALIELLTGADLNVSEFRIRQLAIRNILSCNLGIDWEMYDTKQHAAFTVLERTNQIDSRITCLKQMLRIFCKVDSFEEFLKQVEELDLDYDYYSFKTFDQNASKNWIDASLNGHKNLKEVFDKPSTKDLCLILGLPKDANKNQVQIKLRANPLNYYMTLFAMSEQFCDEIHINDPVQCAIVYNSYNNSIDPYIRAFSDSSTTSMFGQQANRNDGIDVLHFLYLGRMSRLFTEDSKMQDLAHRVGVPCLALAH